MSSTLDFLPATWSFYEMIQALYQAPAYHLLFEVLLIVCIVKLFFSQSYTPGKIVLAQKEKDSLVEEWTPQPLVPDIPDDDPILVSMRKNVINGQLGKYVYYGEKKCLNMGTFNFLNFVGDKEITEEAIKGLRVYGVGSCGPRGFYGTMDVHIKLEEELAKFFGCEEAIVYSYGFATIASIIPAYSKRSDVIFCDEGACFSIQKGIEASRSQVCYFRHNDMDHLEELLQKQAEEDKRNPKKAKSTRRFLIAEGLYVNYGDICPLPKLVELKYKYKVRIFLEESYSFGVLGKTGRGVTEHFGVNVDDVELIASSLENAVATMGGFCVGRKFIIDHQRLSAQGYCFSASQPPMLARAAIQSLAIMDQHTEMFEELRQKSEKIHENLLRLHRLKVVGEPLSPIKHIQLTEPFDDSVLDLYIPRLQGLKVVGEPLSPIKHIQLTEPSDDWDMDQSTLELIVDEARENGIALTLARYLVNDEVSLCPPSIRLTVNRTITYEEIDQLTTVLVNARDTVLAGMRMKVLRNDSVFQDTAGIPTDRSDSRDNFDSNRKRRESKASNESNRNRRESKVSNESNRYRRESRESKASNESNRYKRESKASNAYIAELNDTFETMKIMETVNKLQKRDERRRSKRDTNTSPQPKFDNIYPDILSLMTSNVSPSAPTADLLSADSNSCYGDVPLPDSRSINDLHDWWSRRCSLNDDLITFAMGQKSDVPSTADFLNNFSRSNVDGIYRRAITEDLPCTSLSSVQYMVFGIPRVRQTVTSH